MSYFNFENQKTPINDTNLNAMQKGLMELAFPIGSTYVTQTETNPAEILGFGTWERFKRIELGLDETDPDMNEIGKTGGEKKHSLDITQIPNHSHPMNTSSKDGTHADGFFKVGSYEQDNDKMMTRGTGGGQPFNVMNPFEIVGYKWIRRA